MMLIRLIDEDLILDTVDISTIEKRTISEAEQIQQHVMATCELGDLDGYTPIDVSVITLRDGRTFQVNLHIDTLWEAINAKDN